jgi:site-specific DNA recombinase
MFFMLQTNEMQSAAVFRSRLDELLGKHYSDRISVRVKAAFEMKVKEGECIWKAPIGYLNVRDKRGKADVIIDAEKAPIVRQIFEMCANGSSISDIAKAVNLKTTVVSAILKNPFYYGEMHVKSHDKYYPHKYEKIITKEIFDKCQEVKSLKSKS